MKLTDIARLRLHNQWLWPASHGTPEEVVSHMGAMQAQDYNMCKWAVGVRLSHGTNAAVELAINDGRIIRTHAMRPTWHLVAATDVRWLIALTGPRLRGSLNANNVRMGLTEPVFSKCNSIIEKLLEDGTHMTRKQIMEALGQHGIATNELRASHIMLRAEIDGVVCSGARQGKENTYAHYESRLPPAAIKDRKDAVAELFARYFTSHGPATLHDFVWWSGLTLTDARAGLEANKQKCTEVVADGQTYWYAEPGNVKRGKPPVLLLPAFDEYMVSYKDRTACLAAEHFSNAISVNGIFSPIVVVNGRVAGVWKRTMEKDSTTIAPVFFDSAEQESLAAGLQKAARQYALFAGTKVIVNM